LAEDGKNTLSSSFCIRRRLDLGLEFKRRGRLTDDDGAPLACGSLKTVMTLVYQAEAVQKEPL